jgi:hypothetical protein
MSPPSKDKLSDLEQFEDELIESVMRMSETELHDELQEMGKDHDTVIREFDALLAKVKRTCTMDRLRHAQAQLRAYQEEAGSMSAQLSRQPANDTPPLLLAARKGKTASARDMHSLSCDHAELMLLERPKGGSDDDAR